MGSRGGRCLYTEKELMDEVLKQYFGYTDKSRRSYAGKGKEMIGYTDQQAMEIANELIQEINDTFIEIQKYPIYSERTLSKSKVTSKLLSSDDEDGYKIRINYPTKFLRRESLYADSGHTKRTGGGIDDVFALFTKGYSTSKQAYGFWQNETLGGEKSYGDNAMVATPKTWAGNPFIRDIVAKFEERYPGIKIDYPEEWK